MRYYLVRDLFSHTRQWSHQIDLQLLDVLPGAVFAEKVPNDIESPTKRQLPDTDVVGGCPTIEVLSDGCVNQADRRLVGRLLLCPSK